MPARRFDPLVHFDADGALRSRRFDDIYYQPGRGAEEGRATFLNGCGLPELWRGRQRFTVAETGFGSGLNFLLTWDAWNRNRRPGQRLHYVAVEGYPLTPAELERALAPWRVLAPLATRLRRRYDHLTPGFERLHFDRDRLSLTLLVGEAAAVLEQLEARVDAWYLDGFAPRCNPEMWSREVFAQVARLSAEGARLATYTAAGSVRRGLTAAGFQVRKEAGYGAKRERLVASFRGRPRSLCAHGYESPATPAEDRPIAVVGAGVAGWALARALARRDRQVTLIDAGGGASSNPAAIVMPRLEAGDGRAGRLFWGAYRYALGHWDGHPEWRPGGALLLAATAAESRRQQRIVEHWQMPTGAARIVTRAEATDIAGIALSFGGLWFPRAGRIDGTGLGARQHSAVAVIDERVTSLRPTAEGWVPESGDGRTLSAPGTLILATGAHLELEATAYLPLERWYGHATRIAASEVSRHLQANLVSGRYLTPADGPGRRHWLGATFRRRRPPSEDAEDRANLVALTAAFPELAHLSTGPVAGCWSAVRCATPDRLPVAGALTDSGEFLQRFGWLRRGKRPPDSHQPGAPADGRYLLLGLGARGFTTAPLLAEWLASVICGDPWPLERELALAVHSNRFLLRGLRRGQL